MRARRDRFTVCLAAMACAAALTIPVSANAAGTFSVSGVTPLVTAGGGTPGATSPIAPMGSPTTPSGVALIPGTPIMASSASTNTASNSDQRGPDAKWGDPLSTNLLDSDSVQAGFHYYAGSSQGGSQGGIGFSLTFKN